MLLQFDGIGYDYLILTTYWKDWFNRMQVKNCTIAPKNYSQNDTSRSIKDFIIN